MKLQGSNVKKLSKEQKHKMQDTLDIMTETRKEDSVNLRQSILHKLQVLKEDKQKIIIAEQQIKEKRLRIEGAILILEEVLKDKE